LFKVINNFKLYDRVYIVTAFRLPMIEFILWLLLGWLWDARMGTLVACMVHILLKATISSILWHASSLPARVRSWSKFQSMLPRHCRWRQQVYSWWRQLVRVTERQRFYGRWRHLVHTCIPGATTCLRVWLA
jgi:hypothetical protein